MTPLSEAAKVEVLVKEMGYSTVKAAGITGLSKQSVRNILNGDVGWEERKNKPVFSRYWSEEKARLQHAMTELTKEALLVAHQNKDKASFLQAVTGAGILIDKVRLLAGEPTEIHASVNVHAVADLDKLANMLGQSLVNQTPSQTQEITLNSPKSPSEPPK